MNQKTKENTAELTELAQSHCSRKVYGRFDISKGKGCPVWQKTQDGLSEDQVDEVLSWYSQYPREKVVTTVEFFLANPKLNYDDEKL